MAIFNSYVNLPEGINLDGLLMFKIELSHLLQLRSIFKDQTPSYRVWVNRETNSATDHHGFAPLIFDASSVFSQRLGMIQRPDRQIIRPHNLHLDTDPPTADNHHDDHHDNHHDSTTSYSGAGGVQRKIGQETVGGH